MEVVYEHSAGGVVLHEGNVLTITSASRNSIGLPKGTIDPGESPESAAVREVKEETGYDVTIVKKIGEYTFEYDWSDGTHHVKTITYYVMTLANEASPRPRLQEGEDFVVNWMSPDEALTELTYAESKDAVRTAIKYQESKKILIISVSPDSSLELLEPYADIVILDKEPPVLIRKDYDIVYIRSHFGQPNTLPKVFKNEIDCIVQNLKTANPSTQFIDGMYSVEEIMKFEDKWHQYELFSEYMPRTELMSQTISIHHPIYKKRLSSRGRGVTWNRNDIEGDPSDWIVQESLAIHEELRIYVVKGNVYPIGSVRLSKTVNNDGVLTSSRTLTNEEKVFAEEVQRKAPELDFIGLDVARTANGLKLLEVNRSPGYAKFYELTGVNLADQLFADH